MSIGRVRIGELSRRVGVSRELLRAWERRYGLLSPARSPGGMRLYSDDDERRVRAMQRHMANGLNAAEAARLAHPSAELEHSGHAAAGGLEDVARSLRDALERFDATDERGSPRRERGLGTVALETALAALAPHPGGHDADSERALREVVTPQLRRMGWVSTEASGLGAFLFGLALGQVLAARRPDAGDRRSGREERSGPRGVG